MEKKIIPRAPRIVLTPLHDIFVELKTVEPGNRRRLGNISSSGIGLLPESSETGKAVLPVGHSIEGVLGYRERKFPVRLQVVHQLPSITGCLFAYDAASIRSMISRYFELELSAMQLTEVNPRFLKKQADGISSWFRGADNCELFLVQGAAGVVRFYLSFFGNYLGFDLKNGLRYGKIQADEDQEKIGYKGSDLIGFESAIPPEILEAAIKFIGNIKQLKSWQRDFISKVLLP